ncbi:MAG: hypothetical protein ACRCZB_00510, partial [Bacteroidales bacterium]
VDCNSNLLFILSPNDLVYLPTKEEIKNGINVESLDKKKLYKIVSFTNKRLYAIPYSVTTSIIDKVEYTQLNKIEFIKEKESCIPIKVNRLGNVIMLNGARL